jgi:hypothetical protein
MQPQLERNVVDRVRAHVLVEEPQPLLTEGQRQRPGGRAVERWNGRRRIARPRIARPRCRGVSNEMVDDFVLVFRQLPFELERQRILRSHVLELVVLDMQIDAVSQGLGQHASD